MCPPEFLKALNDAEVSRRNLLKFGLGGTAAAVAAVLAPQAAVAAPRRTISYTNVTDLTHLLGPGSPLWPGVHPFELELVATHQANGYYGNVITYWEHSGTHIDAPIHFDPKGRFIDELLPETLVVPAVVIDVKAAAAKDPAYRLTPDDILAWERRYGRVPQGGAVLINSGWGMRWGNPEQFRNMDGSKVMQFPGFSKEAAVMLALERDVVGIGVDTLSIDHGPSPDFPVHYAYLPTGRWALENLANLDAIPPVGATLFVGAPKVASGSGGPTRVLALW